MCFLAEETHKSSPQETLQLSSLEAPRCPLPGVGVGSCLLDGKAVGNASAAGLGPSTCEGGSCRQTKWIGSVVAFASYLKMKCLFVYSVISI